MKVHFMGIGGSGMSAVAMIAYHQGYKVSGCDLEKDTPYLKNIVKSKIPLHIGHGLAHLKNTDILTVTPAAFFQSKKHPEFIKAKKEGKLMTWQKFLGKYLHKGKRVICISGTHGKSTTTAMVSVVFEAAGRDPSVMVGAKVKKWNSNYRYGCGKDFITESDEFFDNFLNYNPNIIILNNIELDHLDFFKDEKHVIKSFTKHIKSLKGDKTLIINQDAAGIKKLFDYVGKDVLRKTNLYGYTLSNSPLIKLSNSFKGKIVKKGKSFTEFEVLVNTKVKGRYRIALSGDYNVSNALGVIVLSDVLGIEKKTVFKALRSFSGIGRRMELLDKLHGKYIYDDYAHHPTEIRETLKALRQKHPDSRVWAVIEPHSFSRTKGLLKLYKNVFKDADKVIIAPIFRARDIKTFGVAGNSIVNISGHKDICHINNMGKIIKKISGETKKGDVVIVMGAGKSYKLARDIKEALKK